MKKINLQIESTRRSPILTLHNGDILLFVNPDGDQQYNTVTHLTLREITDYVKLMNEPTLIKRNTWNFFNSDSPTHAKEPVLSKQVSQIAFSGNDISNEEDNGYACRLI